MCKGLKVKENTEYWGSEKKQEYLEHRYKKKVENDTTGEVTMSDRASKTAGKGLNLILSQWWAIEEWHYIGVDRKWPYLSERKKNKLWVSAKVQARDAAGLT